MAEGSIVRLESVIAGIRGYIGEQLTELENELSAAQGAVSALGEQLTTRQASIEALEASRALLLVKLNELEGAEADTRAFSQARESREEAGEAVAEEIVAAVGGDAVVGALPTGSTAGTTKLTASQLGVLGFLEATPGVHKVSEIATAVLGSDADNAGLQAIRRALAALTGAELATKSTQSGTAFYSASTDRTAVAEVAAATDAATGPAAEKTTAKKTSAKKAAAKKSVAKEAVKETAAKEVAAKEVAAEPAVAKKTARRVVAKKAPAKSAPAKQAKKPASRTARKATPSAAAAAPAVDATTATEAAADQTSAKAPARKSTAKSGTKSPAKRTVRKAAAKKATAAPAADASAAEKSVRADRTKIVATLLSSAEPLSAGEVSRSVMGAEWKSSDATNFRNVLKSMVAEGVVAEHVGENNRARYTVAASNN